MKRKLRDIAASAFGMCLILLGYIRRVKKEIRTNGYITGIYFHNPPKRLFENLVNWLINNEFTVITSAQLADILNKKTVAPQNAVWISLDDGWKDNMINVVPFAVENKIPLTFFVTIEPVERSGVYWWQLAEKYKNLLAEPYSKDLNKLWEVPESERIKAINELRAKVKDNIPREAMTIEDVQKISSYDFFTIGSHTVNHVITPNCTDEELNHEMRESKKKLEEWTNKPVNFFCYPNGSLSGKEEKFLKENGYEFAAAAENSFIASDTEPYRITRFSVGEGYFYEELCHMFGVWQKAVKKIKR